MYGGPRDDHQMTFDEKLAKRQSDEEKGLVAPRVVAKEHDGGKYTLPSRMSR